MAQINAWQKMFSYQGMQMLTGYLLSQNMATQALAIDANAQDCQTTGGASCTINGQLITSLTGDAAYDISAELPYSAWAVSTAYTPAGIASEVYMPDGKHYACILAHTSSLLDKPGVGANWQTYWRPLEHWAVQGAGVSVAQDKQGHYLVCALADGTLRAFKAFIDAEVGATTPIRIPPYDPTRYVAVGYISVVPTSGSHIFGTTALTTVGTFTQLTGLVLPDPLMI
jgi:hypothetical protein